MKLIIVESPTKARTISKFLGRSYTVKSSNGHIRDLPKKEMGIDIEHDFKPRYIIPSKARGKVAELREARGKAESIILATDEDREGEAIAWHLAQALELKPEESQRIVFHEITKKAINEALEKPRPIDINLVDSQQARRVLDRLVGYELSPFLWKKIKRGLSAGRVQSVALRFIVEREKEIKNFQSQEYWVIALQLKKSGDKDENKFEASLVQKNSEKIEELITLKLFAGDYKTKSTILKDKKSAEEIVKDLEASQFSIKEITKKEILRYPLPPFTTSTLQQAAINSLGFSAKQTMAIAQKLYEEGHITYMRTDSVNLSLESMLAAKKTITKIFGKSYSLPNPKFYQTKSKGAQEAHEAIRPAYPEKTPQDFESALEPNHQKLYALIWKRMIASQMQPAILNSMKADIEAKSASNNIYLLKANGSTVKFDGFLKIYGDNMPFSESALPPLSKNDTLELVNIEPQQKNTSVPPRYSEAALVKVMEENGIGRPSTYAPTISTIIDRNYVDKNEEKKLYPLEIGFLVNDLLAEHFPEVVDIRFTATMEEDLDKIAEGEMQWTPVIEIFYKPFHKNLAQKTKDVKKENILEKLDRKCPQCGGDLIVRFGRFGKFIACAKFPECKYTEKTEEEKKVDEQNKGIICDKCGAPMIVKRGRYGAFLGCSKYPECNNIKKIENTTGIKCPKCGVGEIVERRSKKGRIFYGCTNYPKCNFALWNKPIGKKCPRCESLLVFAPGNKTKCSNKECDFEE